MTSPHHPHCRITVQTRMHTHIYMCLGAHECVWMLHFVEQQGECATAALLVVLVMVMECTFNAIKNCLQIYDRLVHLIAFIILIV